MTKRPDFSNYLPVLGLVAAATALAALMMLVAPVDSVSAVYMLPVLAAAVRYGTGPAIMAALLGAFLTSLFYPPLFSILVVSPPQIVDLIVSLVVALTIGRLAGRVRAEMMRAHESEKQVRQLYGLSREIAGASHVDAIHEIVAAHMAKALGLRVALFLGADGQAPRPVRLPFAGDAPAALAPAVAAFNRGAPAGERSEIVRLPGAGSWLLCSLGGLDGLKASLAVELGRGGDGPGEEMIGQIRSILAEGARSLERLGLSQALEERRLRQRSDALRDILMESVSHELRTPIAGIMGAASVLATAPVLAAEPRLQEMSQLIATEARRLDLRVQNLLDVTRIRSGALEPRLDSVDPVDIVNAALDSTAGRLRERRILRDVAADLPLVRVDPVLIEQALINILENAGKFAPAGSSITVGACVSGDRLAIDVRDEGPGLDERESQQVFERFYRGERHADIAGGSGLGLTIAKVFVEANGGGIAALSEGPGRGTTLRVLLPLASGQDLAENEDD